MEVVWLIAMIVMVLIEMQTMALTTIWFAGGALAALLTTVFGGSVFLQLTLFLLVSLLLLLVTRPLAIRYFNKNRTDTNLDWIIGQTAIVLKEVDNLNGTGQVMLNGMEWSARSSTGNIIIPKGSVVKVISIQGVKLMVEDSDVFNHLN